MNEVDNTQNIGVNAAPEVEINEPAGGVVLPEGSTPVSTDTEEEIIVDDEEVEVTKAPGEDNECLSCQ